VELVIVLAIFGALIPVWCAMARAFVGLPRVETIFRRWGHRIAPWVLVALGIYIMADAGSIGMLLGRFR
jgi:cadmium resistance protein CadD (predicted permease)